MKYLNNWNQLNEADEVQSNNDNPIRSERLLTQAQKEYKDGPELKTKDGPTPTMVFTDVVGSSDMWADDPITMAQQLEDHHKLVDSIASKNKGWIVKTIGDAFMVYFEPNQDSIYNAIKFSKELILSEKAYNLRVGVCSGPMDEKTYRLQNVNLRDFYGNSVNTASRMESKVSQKGGTIAFCSINSIQNKMNKIKTLGEVSKVDLSMFNLRGAKVDEAYRMSVK